MKPAVPDDRAEKLSPLEDGRAESARRMRRRRKKLLAILGLGVVLSGGLVGSGLLFIDWRMSRQMRPYIYRSVDKVPAHDVALVLGARILSRSRLSAMLEDRVLTAVDLYRAGKVKKLLMSGDNSDPYYDEVSAMRRYAIRQGVKSDDVVRDFAGFRTYDSVYRARDLWGLKSMVIVTQDFHLPRSVYTARKLGVDAVGLVADRRTYGPVASRRSRLREILARTGAWLDCNLLHPKPHFLGQHEGLSGDTQKPQ